MDAGSDHGIDLDPEVAARVAHLQGVTVEQFFTTGVVEPSFPDPDPVAGVEWTVEDLDSDGRRVTVRRYAKASGSAEPRPALVWCHGGGWGLGDLAMPEAHVVSQRAADVLDAVVFSVGYGLAPAHPYPQPQRDIVAAFEHALDDPAVDPTRIAVGGASAGGHLAACAAHRLTVAGAPLAAVFLAYPATDPVDGPYPDHKPDHCPELFWFDGPKLGALFTAHAGATPPPTGSVPARLDAEGMPPTLVTTVPADGMHLQAEAHVTKLASAGVDVEHHEVPLVLHGYLNMAGSVAVADAALDRHLAWLGRALR